MTLANDVQWLLYILEDNLARLLKACHLDFDNFSNWFFVLFDILDAFIILDHPWDPKIKATEHNPLLYVLDKGQDIGLNIKGTDIYDVSVDETIADAFSRVT